MPCVESSQAQRRETSKGREGPVRRFGAGTERKAGGS